MKIRPFDQSNKQKYIASLLAAGVDIKEAAALAKVKPNYIEILLQGSMFSLEIDKARTALMREKISEFEKKAADSLDEVINVARQIMLNGEKDADRMTAAKFIAERVAPRANKAPGETQVSVKAVIGEEKMARIQQAMADITPVIEVKNEDS